jgi:hypothetical protein
VCTSPPATRAGSDGSLVATTVGPGAVYRVDADTGMRTKLAG